MATLANLASLQIDLLANSAKMVTELNKANGHLDGFAKKAAQAGKLVKVAFVAATTGMFANMVKESIDSADRLGKLSQRLGASTEALSELQHVADLSGVSFNTMTMGLQRMTRRVSEAAAGSGEAKKALAELGISAQRLNQLAPEKQFEVLADALAGVSNEGDRVRLAMKFFDSEGVALVQTMGQGAEGIRAMREEARKLGITLSQEDAQAAAIFNDQMTRATATMNGFAKEIALNSVTAFNKLTEAFNAVSGEAQSSAPDLSAIQDIIKGAGAAAFVTYNGIQALGQGLTGLAFAVAEVLQGNFKNAISELELGFSRMKDEINEALEGVDRLYNYSGSFPEADAQPEAAQVLPNNVVPIDLFQPGGDAPDPLERLLGANPDETISRLESQLATEEESLINAYVRRQEMLNAYLNGNAGFEKRHQELTLKNQAKFLKAQEALQAKSNRKEWTEEQKRQRMTLSATAGFFGVMAGEHKAFAYGQALINTYLGVSESLAFYPMPAAAIMAATHLAAGMKQVQAIKSGGRGGGVSASTSVGSVSGLEGPESFIEQSAEFNQTTRLEVDINIDDDALLNKTQLQTIVEQINDAAENRNVRIAV